MLASKIFFLCVFLIYVGIVAAHNSAKGRPDDGGITDECLDELGFWPLPSSCSVDTNSMPMFLSPSFTIEISASSQSKLSPSENEMLQKLVERYNKVLKPLMASKNSVPQEGLQLDHLEISVASSIGNKGTLWPSLKDDESYELLLQSSQNASISSSAIWGALRGIETFSQLFDLNTKLSKYSTIQVNDSPRFKYRGIMLDTSRHYIIIETVYALLDAMAYNKFNVLHWHITDDQSFPIESVKYPGLANDGSFDSTYGRHVYTPSDVTSILEYARLRGIRVVPEFDMPGHATSWFNGYPELMTKCPDSALKDFSKPMDVSKNSTYSFLAELLTEMSSRFEDDFFHIGGDEVDGSCWGANKDVQEFCKAHNITSSAALQMYFEKKIVEQLVDLGKTPVIWEENFGSLTGYPKGAVIEIWKHVWGNTTILDEIIRQGHHAIYTTPDWYLDYSTNARKGSTPIPYSRRIDDSSEWQYYYKGKFFKFAYIDYCKNTNAKLNPYS